ncbi:MAG: hypothetical protein JWO31_3977, partial [Phycisphaerales bacterium]|nr:hypothetical protein [Phycisphaerales bacterium]
ARGIEDPVPEQLRGTDLSVDLAPLIVPSRWPQPVAPATFGELAPSGEVPGVGSPAGGGPPPVRMLVRWRMPREPVREEEVDAPADVTGPRRHAGAVWSEVTPIRPGLSPAAGRGE